jgi:cytochrome o ubiquinol oxidase subunit II
MLSTTLKIVRLLPSIVLACALAGCSPLNTSFLDPAGPVAATQRALFFQVIGWMTIVVVPVLVLVPLFAWRFRRGNAAAPYRPEWAFSWPLEFVIWGVPIAIVAVLAVVIVGKENPLDPYAPLPSHKPPLEIQVVGLDWKWLFIYPQQGIATVGTVGLPVDRPVRFRLTSDTVMQSFFIPALGSQIYAMAGMVTQLNLEAARTGKLRGRNTQFNGEGFQHQRFTAVAMTPEDFAGWTATVRARGKPLDAAAYAVLAQRSTAAQAHARLGMTQAPTGMLYFSPLPPNLFADIVAKHHRMGDSVHTARRSP